MGRFFRKGRDCYSVTSSDFKRYITDLPCSYFHDGTTNIGVVVCCIYAELIHDSFTEAVLGFVVYSEK